jgi:hypothetical protein
MYSSMPNKNGPMRSAAIMETSRKNFQFFESEELGPVGAGVNQQPPMHQLRMRPFNPFWG